MGDLFKTAIAAQRLGLPYTQLHSLIRNQKIEQPRKDTSGDYVWSERDLEAVRVAMTNGRQRRAVSR